MNKKSIQYYLKVIILLCTLKGIAQPALNDITAEVKVLARATKKAIKLRWGVTTPLAWQYANRYGFIIKRKTIVKNGEVLKNTTFQDLTLAPIKPKPLQEWEAFTNISDQAAVAAQALYGENFDVNLEKGKNDILSIVNQSKALEQRFSFALSAADQNYKVAEFSGLGYTDTTVLPGEQYLYRIYTVIPQDKLIVNYGGVFIGLQDYQPLPEPLDFIGIFNDRSVMLSWNFILQKRLYNNFIIERSKDKGKTFTPLQGVPVAHLNEKENQETDRVFYIDSLPQNNYEYHYRVKGISPFGEIGPPSQIVKGRGREALIHNPALTNAVLSKDESQVELFWEFPDEALHNISHFKLKKSNTVKGVYTTIQDNISKNTQQYIFNNLDGINYFTVTAVGFQGEERTSFPKMVQLSDNTPPEVPKALTGVIDSTGIVRLKWSKNVEADFLGYRVFKSNLKGEEFYQITFEPVANPIFTDTVKIKSLNSKVYYKIKAYDKRYNPSDFSEVIELKKPDVVPPTQPVIRSYKAGNNGITLKWTSSSSEDALQTLIYRKESGKDQDWMLVTGVRLPKSQYLDATVKADKTYLYTLLTVDDSGLESPPVRPVAVTAARLQALPVARFTAVSNAEERYVFLEWKVQQPIEEFTMYKAEANMPLTVYKIFDAGTKNFKDIQLRVNTIYTYAIQGLLANGSKTPLKKIEIEY